MRRLILKVGLKLVAVICLPIALVIILMRPLLFVRFAGLISTRIGHFAANTELTLCEIDAGIGVPQQRFIDIWCLGETVCNQQLLKMWKRELRILPIVVVAPVMKALGWLPTGHQHLWNGSVNSDRDIHGLFATSEPHLAFTAAELAEGERLLAEFGVKPTDTVVCLNVRDSTYLASEFPDRDWNYHNYRDSKIDTYSLAAEELADQGCFVFRMGQVVAEPLVSTNARVIDYANDDRRSPFLDIYLGWRCLFAVTTSNGWDAIPAIFRRPIAWVNYVPIGYAGTWSDHSVHLFKGHKSLEDGHLMGLNEIFESDVAYAVETKTFTAAGVDLVSNSAEEIRDVAVEMWDRVHDSWVEQPDDHDLQERFWRVYRTDGVTDGGVPVHGVTRMRYGARFLRDNRSFVSAP